MQWRCAQRLAAREAAATIEEVETAIGERDEVATRVSE